jgi:hypothetical protein
MQDVLFQEKDRFHPWTKKKKRVGGTFENLDNAVNKIAELRLLSSRVHSQVKA